MRSRHVVGAAAVGGAVAAYILLVRRWQLRWGATDQECDDPLPGDDLIANADLTATRAITIRASADQVWPWIAQLGQARGGFYSYDFTWAFVIRDAPDKTTRLLVRERYSYTRSWARLIIEPTETISFVMSQKMLRGIRDRAERSLR